MWNGNDGVHLGDVCDRARGVGEKEEEEERDDDGKVEEGALPGRARAATRLMRAIGAVFHVAMIGDDDTVRRAAKTALTQVINATFKRAEKDLKDSRRANRVRRRRPRRRRRRAVVAHVV